MMNQPIARYTSRPAWWVRWKSLRLPWRRRWLVGFDLQGNSFWEFKDQFGSSAGRIRRIVEPDGAHRRGQSRLQNLADLKLSPAWVQWLRNTRAEPPSISEQESELSRQARLKSLSKAADARWDALEDNSMANPKGKHAQLQPRKPTQFVAPANLSGPTTQPTPTIIISPPSRSVSQSG